MFCDRCGMEFSENEKFCPRCGAKVILPKGQGRIKVGNNPPADSNPPGGGNHQGSSNSPVGSNPPGGSNHQGGSNPPGGNGHNYREYHFNKTNIVLDSGNLYYSKAGSGNTQLSVSDIMSIESGAFFPTWGLVIMLVIAAAMALSPLYLHVHFIIEIFAAVAFAAIFVLGLQNTRMKINYPAGKLIIDSTNKTGLRQLVADIGTRQEFKGVVSSGTGVLQIVLFAAAELCMVIMIVRTMAFSGPFNLANSKNFFNKSDTSSVAETPAETAQTADTAETAEAVDGSSASEDVTGDILSGSSNAQAEDENVLQSAMSSGGDYTDYLDWCGDYVESTGATHMWFILYSDGSMDPECGYLTLYNDANEVSSDLFYKGGTVFSFQASIDSKMTTLYLNVTATGGTRQLDLYTEDGYCANTFTMTMSYDDYIAAYEQAANEYVCPGSDTGYIDKSVFEAMSDDELRLARNEIFARYGRMFKDQELQNYFDSKSWYTRRYTPDEFDKIMEQTLNEYEKANITTIQKIEASRK